MELWYKKLGYYKNPFLLSIFSDKTPLIGREKELNDALYYVASGSLVYVQASLGGGKTKFLRTVIDTFKGKIIYVNAEKVTKTIDVEKLLKKKTGAFKKMPKDMILIVDNVDELSPVNYERIKYFYDQGYLQSVIFSGENFMKAKFSESLRTRISSRVIKLPALTLEEAYTFVAKRLDEDLEDEEDALITKNQIKKIYEASKKNHRLFLINLHRVFEEMAYDEDEKIDDKHLEILKDVLDKEDIIEYAISLGEKPKPEELVDDKGNKIMKIGEYYRRPAYDMFCGNCGAIVKEEHTQCPECGAEFEEGEEQ